MKTFRELSEAMLKKRKVWKPDEKGNLKKVLKKECMDADGKAEGYKISGGKCEKMSPSEIKAKKKGAKKATKTKTKHAGKIKLRAAKILKKKIAKGVVNPVGKNDEEN